MIILVGTGHVFNLFSAINKILKEKNPDIICVELDKQRYNTLLKKKKNQERYKEDKIDAPILYKLFVRHQEKMAKRYGVNPGDEMITAIKYAESHELPIEFIDKSAQDIYKRTINSMSLSEKTKISLLGILVTFFGWFFEYGEKKDEQLEKIGKNTDNYLKKFEKKFPNIKRLVIDDRNNYMGKKLIKLNGKYKKILTFIGDGHVLGISEILRLNNIKHEVIRLKDLNKKN